MERDEEAGGRIHALNDRVRCNGAGGTIVIAPGIIELGAGTTVRIIAAVAAFKDFTEDNDPHGEHDCASLTVDSVKARCTTDDYGQKLKYHSPDAADPEV